MASNSFGNIFKITTWGESHGKAIGVVIDGCPAGLPLSDDDINKELALRAPGKNSFTSPRKEPDLAEILSGTFEGKTTGTPISIIIYNKDADSSKYTPIKDLLRPGHANYSYLQKYGIFDHNGGGRASGRETACRVAAGAVAKKLLAHYDIRIKATLDQVGMETSQENMMKALQQAMDEGDSLGGIVEFCIDNLSAGFGDPIYEKLEANLAKAMMSLPATKGFEIGSGFHSVKMKGSEHNDSFILEKDRIRTSSNYSGGTLGGISTGMPIVGRVVFKPTSSIKKTQNTVDVNGKSAIFELPEGSRHDPCIAIRAVPVVEAMAALVTADAILMNRSSKTKF
jgi:chorismate synthase